MRVPLTNGSPCQQLLCLAVLTVLVTRGTTCFIRNCPMGGKRGVGHQDLINSAQRQCIRCGPEGLGHCIGPNICCGASIGCFMKTEESAICRQEEKLETPCRVPGATCGENQEGHCVAPDVCCTDETCRLDSSCHQMAKPKEAPRMSAVALRYLRTLIGEKRRRVYTSSRR